MRGFLKSSQGLFQLASKVTTVGREGCNLLVQVTLSNAIRLSGYLFLFSGNFYIISGTIFQGIFYHYKPSNCAFAYNDNFYRLLQHLRLYGVT